MPSTSSFAALALGLVALAALGACGDEKKGRPFGAACGDDSECGEGSCLAGQCLDPAGDEDRDGLLNELELTLATGLFDPDSDDDELGDRDEVAADFSPVDTDGDGVHDALESDLADGDGDCLSDQRDAEVTAPADVVARVCQLDGVCGVNREVLSFACDGSSKGAVTCDYGAVPSYEASEASCDALDNDCDGATDEDLPEGACVAVPTSLRLVPDELELRVGATDQIVASAGFDDGSDADVTDGVTWISDDPAVATVVAGRVSALEPGTTTIRATLGEGDAALVAVAAVTVEAPPVELVAITLAPDEASTPLGVAVTFTATGRYSDGSSDALAPASLTWRSSRPAIASVDDGVATPLAVGTTTITAAVAGVAGVEGDATLAVTEAEALALRIVAPLAKVALDETLALQAIGTMTDESEADLTTRVTWRSDDPAIAPIDAAGVVTGKSLGRVVITATLDTVDGVLPVDVVVTLRPMVVSRTAVRAARIDAHQLAGPSRVGPIIGAGDGARVIRVDGHATARVRGAVTSQPPVRVHRTP